MQGQQAVGEPPPFAGPRLEAAVARVSPEDTRQMSAGSFSTVASRFYNEVLTPGGELVREHPDGSRELIRIDEQGRRYVERSV